jgi:hypothetical protein
MRGGQHHPEIGAERIGEVGDGRCRHDTEEQDVDTRARESRYDSRFKEFPACATISTHHGSRPMIGERADIGKDMRCGN